MRPVEYSEERLQQAAAAVPRDQEPGYFLYDVVFALDGDSADLAGRTDVVWVMDGTEELHYLVVDGGPTVMAWSINDLRTTENVLIGDLQATIDRLNREFAETNGGQICRKCGEMCHKDHIECPHCGFYVTGEECPELVLPSEFAECLEDGGSDRYTWVLKERLPTHETPSRHSWVFIRLEVGGHERYRGYFEPPAQHFASVRAVNIGMAGKAGAKDAQRSFGFSSEDWAEIPDVGKAQCLMDYGLAAIVWEACGRSLRQLLDQAVEQARQTLTVGGFMLDRPQNAIGNTGWDFMAGNIGFRK